MIAEASAKTAISDVFADIAQVVGGRKELKKARRRGLDFGPLLKKFTSRGKAKPRAKKAG